MPDIGKLISNLHHRRIPAIGDRCGGAAGSAKGASGVISAPHHLVFAESPINTVVGANVPQRLNSVFDQTAAANGKYLHFQDDWSTVADATRAARTVVSGNFSGCQYTVFELPAGGIYRCIHTSRPLNRATDRGDDGYVALMSSYGMQQGWRLVHTFSTAGVKAATGCESIITVTRISYTVVPVPAVRTVCLALNNMGMIIRSTRYTDGAAPETR